MAGMTRAAFKKEHGFRKTLAKIHELVGDAEGVGPHAIKKSCDLVDAELEAHRGDKLFAADWFSHKLGKKRPPTR
jgi:hypothetical protein